MRGLLLVGLAALAAFASPPPRPDPKSPNLVIRRWMRSMTLSQKVAQMVVAPFYGDLPSARSREYQQLARLVRDTQVGGLILVNRIRNRTLKRAEPYALAAFLNRMQKLARTPLLVGADFERGASMRVESTTQFPHAMAFAAARDPDATRFLGEVTAREARALGVHWVMYPVADVNNNPDNPVINLRSYGEDPEEVARHVGAFIQGAHAAPGSRVLTTVKHFPGHGNTAVDTHINLATIPADRAGLDRVEFVPFRAVLAAGVDMVMTAHVAVPAIEKPDLPATLSRTILHDLLREELGFQGLIATDALEMGGVTLGFGTGEAAVRSLEAGADILLMPPDPELAIRAVVAAVNKGRLSTARIEESVRRVLAAKQQAGLDRQRLVDVEAAGDSLDTPEAAQRAQEVAERAVTLLRNEGGLLPVKPGDGACFLILPENRYGIQGLSLAEELKSRAPSAQILALDPLMPESELEDAARKAAACPHAVVFAFASVTVYRIGTVLAGGYPKLMETLLASGKPVTLVALGNPYLIRAFPMVQAYLTTFTPVVPAELAAVKAVFGQLRITGRLPVSIPGIAQYGDGLSLTPK